MSDAIAVKVDGVSKAFKLPHEKQSSIKGVFVSMFRGRRTFERQQVLKDISFEIKEGEFFGIVGRNGSGKSTLLKLLAGIYSPDQGTIQVNGKLTPFIELGVGFNPELTGRENIYLNGALLGFSRKQMDAMYDEIVAFAELEKFMDQKLKNYSSGMQVRLAFSIAIRANTDVLLIDEVLAVGDANFQRKCFDYFNKLKAAKKTVVFVSHDVSAVRRMCDRAMLIDQGKIMKFGDGAEIANEYLIINAEEEKSEKENKKTAKKPPEAPVGEVSILNSDHKPQSVFGKREPLTVRFNYANPKQLKLHFGVQIFDEYGQYCFGSNSRFSGEQPHSAKKGQVELVIHQTLGNGNFMISVATMDENADKLIDYKQKVKHFIVNTGKEFEGLLTLDHDWKIK